MIKMAFRDWLFVVGFSICLSANGVAQQPDSINQQIKAIENEKVVQTDPNNSTKPAKEKWLPNPKKAVLWSIIPGGGQIYNRKYAWLKVPITYGGLFTLAYFTRDNHQTYVRYRDAYLAQLRGENHEFTRFTIDGVAVNPSNTALRNFRDRFDKFRQQTAIGIGAVYLAQMLESYVAAHLMDFDIDDDLTMKIRPQYEFIPFTGNVVGVGATLEF